MRASKAILASMMFLLCVVSLPAQRWTRNHDVYPGTTQQPDTSPQQNPSNCSPIPSQSILDQAGAQINPGNVNYGGLLAEWRLGAVNNFLESFYYWAIVGQGIAIIFLLFYIIYLENEKQKRLRISTDIVCQLYNAWAYSNAKVRATIKKHNAMVDRLNDQYEQQLRRRDGPEVDGSFALPGRNPIVAESGLEQNQRPQEEALGSVDDEMTEQEEDRTSMRPSASIPMVDASRYSKGLEMSPVNIFKMSSPDLSSSSKPVSVANLDIDSALANANKAAEISADSSSGSAAAEAMKLQAQVRAQADKIRALQNQINRDREKRAMGLGEADSTIEGDR